MNKYQEALKLLKEYHIGEELNIVDKINYNARLEKIIDLLQELVDKAIPMKVTSMMLWVNIYEHNCPLCEEKVDKKDYYCRSCGQSLDWSER